MLLTTSPKTQPDSCAILYELNRRGREDVLVVDVGDHPCKQRNLASLRYRERIGLAEFRYRLSSGVLNRAGVSGVLHIGACSATTETDWNYLADNNVADSQEIIGWCVAHGVRCVYASSAATYGNGDSGFSDGHDHFDRLVPLNLYGQSKLEADTWTRNEGSLRDIAGLRYFNVFGPNEWHKGGMRSVVNKKLPEVLEEGVVKLFKSHRPDYADGAQERDFIYVRDFADITIWFLEHREASGVLNVGTGVARTWNEMATAMFNAVERPVQIEYVDMPGNLREQHQYHTKADITKLRSVGYTAELTSLEEAIANYVRMHLIPDRHFDQQ